MMAETRPVKTGSISEQAENVEKNRDFFILWLTAFFSLFIIAVFVVFIVGSVLQVRSATGMITARLSKPVIDKALEVIDGDQFGELLESMDDTSEFFIETQQKLVEINKESQSLFLYTMAPVDGDWTGVDFFYVIDGSFYIEEDADEISPLGTEEDTSSWDAAFFEAISTQTLQMGQIDQNEEWGAMVSSYAPIFNSQGTMVGILGCDIEAASMITWLRGQVSWQMAVVLGFIALGLGVFILLIRKVTQVFKIRSLAETLREVRAA
jgi:hypothetical protein